MYIAKHLGKQAGFIRINSYVLNWVNKKNGYISFSQRMGIHKYISLFGYAISVSYKPLP